MAAKTQSPEASAAVQIVDFDNEHAADFKRLNVQWITQHWVLEAADFKALDAPKDYILDRGGAILIALLQERPVGTVALLPHDAATLELAKMAVCPTAQGKGIGLALASAAIDRAATMGAGRVYLETNTILEPALALYQKLGFSEVLEAQEPSPYERCNLRMEKMLT